MQKTASLTEFQLTPKGIVVLAIAAVVVVFVFALASPIGKAAAMKVGNLAKGASNGLREEASGSGEPFEAML